MDPLAPIPGQDPAFLDALEHLGRAASVDKPCLVVGERGTGKELFATRLHYLSPRWDQTVLKVNCAALTESLLESELFGHEAGAFTGATRQHRGCFERADGGTLVLDEIASASAAVQEKLLRVVEYGELQRVGGSDTIAVDVRVVGASNVDLPSLAERGEFRADLLDRLAFDVVTIPPLRARPADIVPLAEGFALEMTRMLGREVFPGFALAAEARLAQHPWYGNVRELKNVVERAVYLSPADAPAIDVSVFDPFASPWRPADVVGGPRAVSPAVREEQSANTADTADEAQLQATGPLTGDFTDAVASYERSLLVRAMARAENNQRRAADLLGLGYHQLRRLLAKHDVPGKRVNA